MRLSTALIVEIHRRLIETSGGSFGIRDAGLLDSAVNTIYQTHDGRELYPSALDKAARLCFGLIKNHPFVDGNKRIAMHMLALFLRFHDLPYKPSNEDVVHIGVSLASNNMSYEALRAWIQYVCGGL